MNRNTVLSIFASLIAFAGTLNEVRGQSVSLMYGAQCVNESSLFVLNCYDCTNIYWHYSSPAVAETGQGTTSFRVKWTSPATNVSLYVTYSTSSYPYSGGVYSDFYTITNPITPSVSLPAGTPTICQNDALQLTVTPSNAGTSRYYTWYVDGAQVQAGSSATLNYSTSSLSPGSHSTYVKLTTSGGGCFSSTTATSSTKTFYVNARQSFSVDVEPTQVICADATPTRTFYASVSGSVGSLSYQWFKDNVPVGSNSQYLSIAVGSGTTIRCEVSTGQSCVTSSMVSDTYTVSPIPLVQPVAYIDTNPVAGYCPGQSIVFTASSPQSTTSSTYAWYLNGSLVGSSSEVSLLASATTESGKYYAGSTLTVTIGNLSGQCLNGNSANATAPSVTIKTVPTADASAVSAICSGDAVAISISNPNNVPGTSFSWTAAATGVSGSANGSGNNISQTLSTTGSSNGSVTYTITPTASGCIGSAITRTVSVKRRPTVAVTPTTQTICSGTSTGINISNPNAVAGSTFSWTVSAPGISGAQSGSGSSIQQTLTHTGNINKSATYSVIATASSCSSGPANATISVKPRPTIQVSPSSGELCSGESTEIAITNPNGVSGTTFSWTVSAPNISGAGAGSGNTIEQVLTQGTNSTKTASYTVSASANACSSTTTATVSVKPLPDADADDVHYLFSGNSTAIALSTPKGVSGTTFNWTASADNVNGASTGTGSSINQMLTTAGGGSVAYTVTPTANQCDGPSINTSVTVFPTPSIAASNDRIIMGQSVTLSINGSYEGYSWKKGGDIVGSGQSITVNSAGVYTVTVDKMGVSGVSAEFVLADQLDGLNENYIVTETVMVPGVTDAQGVEDLGVGERNQTIQYFDGLGRLKQTVTTQGSPDGNDLIQPVVYDEFGREAVKYLPYASSNANGHFVIDAVTEQLAFYDPLQPASEIALDGSPFAVTKLESSPLSRVLEQGAPGNVWQPGTGKTIKMSYEGNGLDEVRLWTYTAPSAAHPLGLIASQGPYGENQLYKNVTTDEHGNDVIEYIDKQGRTVLKRVQAVDDPSPTTDPAITDSNYASTYYVYDDFGNLVCVIQPEGVENIGDYLSAVDGNAKENFLQKWAFRYRYDERRRMIIKQVPGADSVVMVYDARDRLVLSQDGNRRIDHQWLFTKYDELNRPVLTGIYDHGAAIIQDLMRDELSTNSISESYDGTGSNFGYTNQAFPTTNTEVLTVTYYDDYSFRSLTTELSDVSGPFAYKNDELVEGSGLKGQDDSPFDKLNGLVTGTVTRVLNSTNWLWTVNYYDDRYRVIQATSSNHKGGHNRITNVYDFVGKVLRTKTRYLIPGHANYPDTYVQQCFSYDHAGRLLKTWHQITGGPEVVISANEYNEVGQLVTKKLHSEDNGATFEQDVDYRYNIRGWLTKINDPASPSVDDLFNMELRYDAPTSNGGDPQYNGNISEAIWRSAGLDDQSYGYDYDPMNRLEQGLYYNIAKPVEDGRYNEVIGGSLPAYDLNGNIQNLVRNGKTGEGTFGAMDNLHYDYANSGNRLLYVSDALATQASEGGFTEVSGGEGSTDYAYDDNGNLIKDENKAVTSIKYNYLNLPDTVRKSATEYIAYTYDATGRKLVQRVSGSEAKATEYVGDLVFEDDVLQFVLQPEGRVVADTASGAPDPWEYQYFLKDHLGNTRVVFSENKSMTEYRATLEDDRQQEEMNDFPDYPGFRASLPEFDHTDSGGVYNRSLLLNGGNNSQVGLAKSFAVAPGDVFDLEVYTKYEEATETPVDVDGLLDHLTSAFALGSNTSPLDGAAAYSAFEAMFQTGPWITGSEWDEGAPKAYLNYILFDENFVLLDFGFDQISAGAEQAIPGPLVAHDYLSLHVKVEQKGYLYVYLSNEQPVQTNVYFDDLKIVHYEAVEQVSDYYPFGLTFNSFKREGSVENRIKFQGQERITDLDLNWDAFRYRNYMPEIGRFFNIDPLSDKYVYNSPYAFAENKLGLGIELEGLELLPFSLMSRAGWMTRVTRSMEKHHLIPRQHKLDKVIQQARKDGFKLEGKENKIELEKFSRKTGEGRHGNHPDYNKKVGEKLSEFGEKNPNPGPGEAGKFVKDLAKGLSEIIKNNPETKINDLFKPNGTAAVPGQVESDIPQSSEASPEQKFEMKEGLRNQEEIRQGLENLYNGMQEAEEKMLNDPI